MRRLPKILLLAFISLILSTSIAYATSSSDYFVQAKAFIDKNCNNNNLNGQTALNCYLFHKVNENQYGNAGLKTFDANNNELGIYMDHDTFFYAPLNKVIDVNLDNGQLVNISGTGSIYYTQANCTGVAYLWPGGLQDTLRFNTLYPELNGKFYVLDETIPLSANEFTFISSYVGPNNCDNGSVNHAKAFTLKEISIPMQNPVTLPLKYKFQ